MDSINLLTQSPGIYSDSWDSIIAAETNAEFAEILRLMKNKGISRDAIMLEVRNALTRTARHFYRKGEIVSRNYLAGQLQESAKHLTELQKEYR